MLMKGRIVGTPSWNEMPAPQRKAFFQGMSGNLPVQRIGRGEDLAEAVLFLMQNGFTTACKWPAQAGLRVPQARTLAHWAGWMIGPSGA